MVNHALSGLRSARIEANIDPQVLADRLGMHLNSYYRFENGTRRIYFDKAAVLADAIGVSLDRLRHDPEQLAAANSAAGGLDGTVVAALDGWEAPQ